MSKPDDFREPPEPSDEELAAMNPTPPTQSCPKCGYDGDMPFHTCKGTPPTQTPRTKAEIERICKKHRVSDGEDFAELSDFAYVLEGELLQAQRELAEAKKRIGELEKWDIGV